MKGFLILAIVANFLFCQNVLAQVQDLSELKEEVNKLLYQSKYDSAQALTLEYLKREELTPLELYHGHSLYAETIRASGRPEDAIAAFKLALEIARMLEDSALYMSRVNMSIAGSYFDVQNYEKAMQIAQKSIALSPDTSLSGVGHAPNYLILGFGQFQRKNYQEAETYLERARAEYLQTGNACEMPLYYTKMAQLQNERGNEQSALAYIDSSRQRSSQCEIKLYELITEMAIYEINLKNGEYKRAIEQSEKVSELREELFFDEQQQRMQTMEREYEQKLQQTEIENLREINKKNEEILFKQRQNLGIAIGALLILGVLTVLLIVMIHRRRKANAALKELNESLESKVSSRTAHLEEAYERIQAHSETLDRQNKQLTDFYHMITHNLRAPLGNLSALVKLVDESDDPAKQREMVEHMAPVVENLNFTVNELLEAIQYSARNTAELTPVAFEEALENASKSLQSEIDRVDATIESDFSEAPEVLYPDNYLTSLFHNLLSNSLKYRSPDRPLKIQVSSQKQGETIILKFQDNGIGIDMKKYGHKLFKAGQVFSDHPDAKGFGLYMTKMQVENNGGKIRIESAPDKGSVVVVEFGV